MNPAQTHPQPAVTERRTNIPFDEQYARESVPEQRWSSPRFKAINRRLTTMWACVFTAMVPLHVIAGALDTQRGNLIFNWALPIALVVWSARRTNAAGDEPATARGLRR